MTPDEATEALARAIADHAIATGQADPEDEMLNHFVVIAHWQPIEDTPGEDHYSMASHSENTPSHVLTGLLRVGEQSIIDNGDGL
jgi:hypothetical protein